MRNTLSSLLSLVEQNWACRFHHLCCLHLLVSRHARDQTCHRCYLYHDSAYRHCCHGRHQPPKHNNQSIVVPDYSRVILRGGLYLPPIQLHYLSTHWRWSVCLISSPQCKLISEKKQIFSHTWTNVLGELCTIL